MCAARQGSFTSRRGLLRQGATLAGALTLPSGGVGAAGALAPGPITSVRLAQAGTDTAGAVSAIMTKSTRLVGTAIDYTYAVKAGPWVFLNGHEAFDFERGLVPEVEGPVGNRLSGRPPHAHDPQGIRHRFVERSAGRSVLYHGSSGVGLSSGALRRIWQLHPAEHLDHYGALLHGAY